MKKFIKSEKFIYILIALVFVGAFITVHFKTEQKLEKIGSAEPVVIHDVTFEEGKEEKKVFVTPSGKKYHLDGCEYLGEKRVSVSKEDAENAGYEPCAYCQP